VDKIYGHIGWGYVHYNRYNMAQPNIQRVIKVGNSLAVILPKYLTSTLQIERGDVVILSCVEENEVRVRKIDEKTLRNLRMGFIQ